MQTSQGWPSGDHHDENAHPAVTGAVEARTSRRVFELRSEGRELPPLYVRTCVDCGHFEVSEDPRLFWRWRECPVCAGQAAA